MQNFKNIAVDGEVKVTTDVSIFTPYKNNRKVVRKTVNTVKKGIRSGQWYKMSLFICAYIDGALTVLDGNNRIKAVEECNEEGLFPPIFYVVLDIDALGEQGITPDSFVQDLNNNRKNWSLNDWVEFYCSIGNEEYIRFCNLAEKYFCKTKKDGTVKTNYRYLARLVTSGQNTGDDLKGGGLKITLPDDVIEYHYRILENILERLGLHASNSWLEQFIQGWLKFYNSPSSKMRLDRIGIKGLLDKIPTYAVNGNNRYRIDATKLGKANYWNEFFTMASAS